MQINETECFSLWLVQGALGSKDVEIRKVEFVEKTQFLSIFTGNYLFKVFSRRLWWNVIKKVEKTGGIVNFRWSAVLPKEILAITKYVVLSHSVFNIINQLNFSILISKYINCVVDNINMHKSENVFLLKLSLCKKATFIS